MMNGISPVGNGTLTIYKMGLSKDDFLRLLTEELKNQNPLEPLGNQEFIAQLATFSILEQIILLNDFMNINSKANVIAVLGKKVTVEIGGETIKGKVEGINYKDNIPYIKVSYPGGKIETKFTNIVSIT